ncbi:hypothetical protein M8U43_26770, partial [Enterobacter hormaechei]|nr:hypothetical protein [Enterobacter hormaechei]
WKPPAHSPEENMVRQKCSGIRRSYLVFLSVFLGLIALLSAIKNGSDELAVFLITLSAWFAALSKFYSLKLYKNS